MEAAAVEVAAFLAAEAPGGDGRAAVSSGIYFARLTALGRTLHEKLVVIK